MLTHSLHVGRYKCEHLNNFFNVKIYIVQCFVSYSGHIKGTYNILMATDVNATVHRHHFDCCAGSIRLCKKFLIRYYQRHKQLQLTSQTSSESLSAMLL